MTCVAFLPCAASPALTYDNFAAFAFTGAVGDDIGVVGQREMDQAAIGRGHWLKGNGATVFADPVGHAGGQVDELLFAALAVVRDIQGDPAFAGKAAADDEVNQVLEMKQGIAAAADESAKVVAIDIDDSERGAAAVADADWLAKRYVSIDIQDAEDVVDDGRGHIDQFVVDVGFDGWRGLLALT